jgi:hypothetical protein
MVCDALLPDYAFSLSWERGAQIPATLPVIPVRPKLPPYAGPPLPWPPGWAGLWQRSSGGNLLVGANRAEADLDSASRDGGIRRRKSA